MMKKRWVKNDQTDWSFQGKGPEWVVEEGGQYKITVSLEASQTAEIELNEAAILIRK